MPGDGCALNFRGVSRYVIYCRGGMRTAPNLTILKILEVSLPTGLNSLLGTAFIEL